MATLPKSEGQSGKLKYIPWKTVELEDLNPLLQRQMVVGEKMMLARVLLKKGCVVPFLALLYYLFTGKYRRRIRWRA